MKKKHIGLLLIILIIIATFLYMSNIGKVSWAKESPKTKYTKAREKEIWGKVLHAENPALFYGTPLYDLAKEIASGFGNHKKIEELINEIPKEYINFPENKFAMTIGQFALETKNMFAIRKLLDKGLDPNLITDQLGDGRVLIIDINRSFYGQAPESLGTLEYMIKKGANVNLISKHNMFKTPLLMASSYRLENVKALIKAGANPHFIDSSVATFKSPLSVALKYKHINIVNYLVFDQKVDFRTLKYPMDSKFHPGEYEILHNLREMFFDLNTEDFKEKMKLVAYLKTQGLDYWKTPIQERYKNNPNYTQDYLSKY